MSSSGDRFGPRATAPRQRRHHRARLGAGSCLLLVVACSGQISSRAPGGTGQPGAAPADNPASGPGGSVAPGGSGPGGLGAPSVPAPAAAPAMGQRLTDRQFVNVINDVFGVDVSDPIATMPLDPKVEGFRNAAVALLPSDLRVEGYSSLASAIVGKVDWTAYLAKAGICGEFSDKCQRDFVTGLGRRLFRRPLTDGQIARFSGLFTLVKQESDPFPVAAALAASAMLQSPEFLYRLEHGAAQVDDHEVATRLAFLIWNSTPDDALLDVAARSGLGTPAGLRAEVTRLLADPRAHRALRDYVDDWLDAERLLRTSRDPDRFPQFTGTLAAEMREEIQRLFEKVVWQDDADLTDVLRADRTAVTPGLAALYGLTAGAGTGFAEQSLTGNPNRQGLLSQPGILTLTSVGGAGSSIAAPSCCATFSAFRSPSRPATCPSCPRPARA